MTAALDFRRRPRVEVRTASGRVAVVSYPRTAAQVAALARRAEEVGGALEVRYSIGHGGKAIPSAQAARTNDGFFAGNRTGGTRCRK